MHAIRGPDSKVQEAQTSLVKSSYHSMRLAEELSRAHTEGKLTTELYDVFSDHCLHAVSLNSLAIQQLDQVKRSDFKTVLPTHLRGLSKAPTNKHTEIFGDDLLARQKELKDKADLAASLTMLHPLHKKLSLLAVHLSGRPSQVSAYQAQLRPSYRHHGIRAPERDMTHFSEDGMDFVLHGKSIPCLPLS